ncbi:TonB-dependent receptor [Massilia sp. ST3]|uniref:TonB-dependent receptor n=1 Tax=Massilia sp. ST3 TaxID=2824903 RepID=UPI001B81F1E4|nr:TonB-dependent receptor [Massilia sp. ST3]MBQ5947102.1 TonB-dependent receptor [Massilia sp. ST3]
MTFKMKSLPFAVACVVASGALIGAPAMAQDQAPAAQAPQRVVVTGSLISRSDIETPSPIQVITADEMVKTGKTSVAEILGELAANGQGALGTGFPGAFANGASGVSLRGLTVGLTLVLVDGHRVASYPLSDDAQRSFVDVSNIPFDLIDRVEVLKGGASSIYGSDAVAGVVNIILKKKFNGTRLNAEAGHAQHGGARTKKASITSGFGDLDEQGFNVFGSIEYRDQEGVRLSQRDDREWANGDYRSRGGYDLRRGVPTALNNFLTPASSPFLYTPGAGGANNPANFQFLDPSCNYQLYRAGNCMVRDVWSWIAPPSDNLNLLVGATKKLNDDWTLSMKASMFERHSQNNRGTPTTFSASTFAGFTTYNNGVLTPGVGRIPSTLLPATHPLNRLGAPARLYGYVTEAGAGIQSDNTSRATRFAADLNGSAMGWDINAALGYSKVKTDITYSGYVNRVALINAVNNNTFNPLGGNSPGILAQVAPVFDNTLESDLTYFDIAASRDLMQLGEGQLKAAAGFHYHDKSQNSPASPLTANGTVANTSAFVFGEEKNTAVFAELSANPIKSLEMNLSARYDHYDTYGNSFTPSAKFKWSPNKMFALRGSFDKGFRAPNASEVGNAGSFFLFNGIDDPVLCADGNINTPGNVPAACGIQPTYVQTTEADVEPEKAKSYTLGVIVEPIQGLSATLDYYRIKMTGQITSAVSVPGFTPDWVRNPAVPTEIRAADGSLVVGTPSVGFIAYGPTPYVNLGGVETHGLELDLSYRHRMGAMGNLRTSLNFAHTFGYEIDTGTEKIQLAGTHGPSAVGGNTGNPKNRANFTLGWDRGPLAITTTVNWVDKYSALDPSVGANDCSTAAHDVGGRTMFDLNGMPASYCTIRSFTTTNLNVTYKFNDNLTLKGSVLNVFDREPPIDVATYGSAGNNLSQYNSAMHQAGAIGRSFSLGLNYTF